MCGIVGYIGENKAIPYLIEGLSKLEYRGYDSSGIAVNVNNSIEVFKKKGRLKNLEHSALKENMQKIRPQTFCY